MMLNGIRPSQLKYPTGQGPCFAKLHKWGLANQQHATVAGSRPWTILSTHAH